MKRLHRLRWSPWLVVSLAIVLLAVAGARYGERVAVAVLIAYVVFTAGVGAGLLIGQGSDDTGADAGPRDNRSDEKPTTPAFATRAATLRGASLRGADLTNSDLAGTDLRGADLTNARLDGANLAGARLGAEAAADSAKEPGAAESPSAASAG